MSTKIHINIPQLRDGIFTAKVSAVMKPGMPVQAGELQADFKELTAWANNASSESLDFLLISFFIYGIDRFVQRKRFSTDGWSREFEVEIPVFNFTKWKGQKSALENLLSFLTGDYWSLSFYKNNMEDIPNQPLEHIYKQKISQVNLFSGGIDSLIGAIDLLENSKTPALFISHYDSKMHGPRKDQRELGAEMEKQYGNNFIKTPSVRVDLNHVKYMETTCRSRSILFIGLANLFADVLKVDICVPENGTVSVNYPLSPSRRSACSTRTTHPTFLNEILTLWKQLGITTSIYNPYMFKTKGEMVNECANPIFFNKILALSNSCGKRGHRAHWDKDKPEHSTHCGICMPCIYRRAALTKIVDRTVYGNNINKLNFTMKKGQDVGTMLDFLHKTISKNEIKFELISNGLKDQAHLYAYITLVEKTRKELADWIIETGNIAIRTKAGL